MIYNPYKNLNWGSAFNKYLAMQNLLMKMSNMTLLSMLLSTSLFLVLLTYTIYNDLAYQRVAWAVVADIVLNLYNIYLHLKPSDSFAEVVLLFLPEVLRGLSVASFLIFIYVSQESIWIYLTLIYVVPMLFRLFSCIRYSRTRFNSVLTEAILYLTAYLFMSRLCLNRNLPLPTCIAPLFYFTICLAILRICLLIKALFFIFGGLFKCYSGTNMRGRFDLIRVSGVHHRLLYFGQRAALLCLSVVHPPVPREIGGSRF